MDNQSIVKLLRWVAAAYTIGGVNRFRIIAYERAADAIEHATSEVKDLWEQGNLEAIPGIGTALSGYLDELFKTGQVKHFKQILNKYPRAMFDLLAIPGFGPKKSYKLTTSLHLEKDEDPIAALKLAAIEGRVAKIEGFGAKSAEDIVKRICEYESGKTKGIRMILPYAIELAEAILAHLRKDSAVLRAEPLGSLRRKVATVGDIDIAVATRENQRVLDWFTRYPAVQRVIEKGPATSSILVSGNRQIDLMVQPPDSFGALLQHFTGSKEHNIHLREYAQRKGLSLSEYGIKKRRSKIPTPYASEEGFYNALGLKWIPPELREDQGEIEASLENRLPKLVELEDIRGDLHLHSNYDLKPSHDLGKSSVADILLEGQKRGYDYIGISDHNPRQTNNSEREIMTIMTRRKEHFEQIVRSTKNTRVHLFIMLEIDILPDGRLALPDAGFNLIDAAIVSVHSSFNLSRDVMTERVLKALSHPKVKILGHPTGRLLERREGFELNWTEVFSFCRKYNKALEINAYPDRLDLPDSLVHQAIDHGVKLIINTDSHEKDQMSMMRYGVAVARRGWAKKTDVLNVLPYNGFKKWLIGGEK